MVVTHQILQQRREQRGAALFLVVMVISLVTAVSIFSMRAASLGNVAAGYNRQSLQAGKLAMLATRAAATYLDGHPALLPLDDVTSGCAPEFINENEPGEAFCEVIKGARMEEEFLQIHDGFPGQLSVKDGTGTGVKASMAVEIANGTVGHVTNGDDLGSGELKTITVTITGRAQVFPFDPSTTGMCTAGAEESIAEHAVRRYITVPSN